MTLQKAIEISALIKQEDIPVGELDKLAALNLLIEAGQRILRQRTLTIPVNQPPLPGEEII